MKKIEIIKKCIDIPVIELDEEILKANDLSLEAALSEKLNGSYQEC